jgi:hypothetical protein
MEAMLLTNEQQDAIRLVEKRRGHHRPQIPHYNVPKCLISLQLTGHRQTIILRRNPGISQSKTETQKPRSHLAVEDKEPM